MKIIITTPWERILSFLELLTYQNCQNTFFLIEIVKGQTLTGKLADDSFSFTFFFSTALRELSIALGSYVE